MLKITKTGITFNCTVYRGFRVSWRRFQQLELSRGNKCLFANSTASHSHLIHFNYSTQNGEFTLYNNSEFRQRTVSFRCTSYTRRTRRWPSIASSSDIHLYPFRHLHFTIRVHHHALQFDSMSIQTLSFLSSVFLKLNSLCQPVFPCWASKDWRQPDDDDHAPVQQQRATCSSTPRWRSSHTETAKLL